MRPIPQQAALKPAPDSPISDELHIISLIVHTTPACTEQVSAAIVALPEARIHGADPNGKLVVTLEAPSSAEILDQVGEIQRSHGVINVSMVYQHVESLESLNTEMQDANHPT